MYTYTVEPLYIQNDQDLIACDYYRPINLKQPAVIIMAHGFAALRQFKLIEYAQRFAQAGYAVILFDYRSWGGSTGKPRELVSIEAQMEDWFSVISHTINHKDQEINNQNIVLWGTGLSAGYVMQLAAELKNIRAVMLQVAYLDGAKTAKLYPIQHSAKALKLSSQDYMRSKVGLMPIRVPVVHPFALSFFPHQDSYNGYMSIVNSDYFWSGEVPARSLVGLFRFKPIAYAAQIKIPTLMIAAKQDNLTPIESTREAATNLGVYVEYHEWDMAHFDIYQQPWLEKAISTQLLFLEQHVGVS